MLSSLVLAATLAGTPPELEHYTGCHEERAYRLFRLVDMPAVLIENLQLANVEAQELWTRSEVIDAMTARYADGIQNYIAEHVSEIDFVYVDDGHGKNTLGAPNPHNEERSEYWYTSRIQESLVAALNERGINAVELDVDSHNRNDRLMSFAEQANTTCLGNCFYIAVHADATPGNVNHYPRIFSAKPYNLLKLERWRKDVNDSERYDELKWQSAELAQSILESVRK